MSETRVGGERVQAEGLDFGHVCSESGPEARLGLFNTQTQIQVARSTRQLSPEAGVYSPRAVLLDGSPPPAGKQVMLPLVPDSTHRARRRGNIWDMPLIQPPTS